MGRWKKHHPISFSIAAIRYWSTLITEKNVIDIPLPGQRMTGMLKTFGVEPPGSAFGVSSSLQNSVPHSRYRCWEYVANSYTHKQTQREQMVWVYKDGNIIVIRRRRAAGFCWKRMSLTSRTFNLFIFLRSSSWYLHSDVTLAASGPRVCLPILKLCIFWIITKYYAH